MVALTPSTDNFRGKCIIAIVAARPVDNVKLTPSLIDVYFARPEEIELDPQQEFVMIEARTGYYEGTRHTLRALQKLHQERLAISASSGGKDADSRTDFLSQSTFVPSIQTYSRLTTSSHVRASIFLLL